MVIYLRSNLIEGQHLGVNGFARFDITGVWVPVTPELETADYGAGGFHLPATAIILGQIALLQKRLHADWAEH